MTFSHQKMMINIMKHSFCGLLLVIYFPVPWICAWMVFDVNSNIILKVRVIYIFQHCTDSQLNNLRAQRLIKLYVCEELQMF